MSTTETLEHLKEEDKEGFAALKKSQLYNAEVVFGRPEGLGETLGHFMIKIFQLKLALIYSRNYSLRLKFKVVIL